MESGIAVRLLASTEPDGALERVGVALETRDGGVVENNVLTDSAVAKGGENHARHIPESDSPEKPDTPPSRLSLDQLRAEIDAAVGTLPEILRVCTVDALTERVAPVFQDADHTRSPALDAHDLDDAREPQAAGETQEANARAAEKQKRWEAFRSALAVSPSRRAEDLAAFHEAASALEHRIRAADAPTPVDADEAFAVSAPLGVGLVACGACGRVLAREALRRHKATLCARVAAALGERGVAARLRDVKGALNSLERPSREPPLEGDEATTGAPAATAKPAARRGKKKENEREGAKTPDPPLPLPPAVPKEKRSKKPRKARADLSTRVRGHANALALEAREVTFGGEPIPGFPAHFAGWDVSPGTGLGPPGLAAGTGTNASYPLGFPGYPRDGFHPHVYPQHVYPQHGVPAQHVSQLGTDDDLQRLLQLRRENAKHAFHQEAARFFPGQHAPQQYFPQASAYPGYPMGAFGVGVGSGIGVGVGVPHAFATPSSGSHPGSPHPPGLGAPAAPFVGAFDSDFGLRFDGGKRRRGDEAPSAHPSARAPQMHAQQQTYPAHARQMYAHQVQQVRQRNDGQARSGGNA